MDIHLGPGVFCQWTMLNEFASIHPSGSDETKSEYDPAQVHRVSPKVAAQSAIM